MGNRAVITNKEKEIGIYLHWNGGKDSVEGFLTYCKMKNYREDYGMARLAQTICNFFDDGLSCDIDRLENLDCDNWDNGMYIIDTKTWKIIGREYEHYCNESCYSLLDMLIAINDCQPENVKVSKEEIYSFLELPYKYVIRDREAGNRIDAFYTYEDAQNALDEYEKEDISDDTYSKDFYEIVEV